jgi:hypothetical protein
MGGLLASPDAAHPEPLAGEATGWLTGPWPKPLTRLKTSFHGEARAPALVVLNKLVKTLGKKSNLKFG